MPSLGGWEFVILIGILVLLFGAKRLPDMARSIGQSARVFKGEMKGMKDDGTSKSDSTTSPQAAATPPAPLPPAAPVTPAAPVNGSAPVTPAVQPEPAPTPGQGHNSSAQ